jgi:predicted acyl esterase
MPAFQAGKLETNVAVPMREGAVLYADIYRLVYSTPPLEHDVEVTGPLTVTLWAVTSAPDTDCTAKLVDVCAPGGTRISLTAPCRVKIFELALQFPQSRSAGVPRRDTRRRSPSRRLPGASGLSLPSGDAHVCQ